MALTDLLQELDDAVTEAETLKADAAAKAQAAAAAQAAHEQAVAAVLDLQAKLRDRLGPVVGGSGRVRQ